MKVRRARPISRPNAALDRTRYHNETFYNTSKNLVVKESDNGLGIRKTFISHSYKYVIANERHTTKPKIIYYEIAILNKSIYM